jgi:predicted ATPase/DNA-binding SARP family transcriptional activator
VEVEILGPLQVTEDGRDIALGAAKPRALLLRLAVDANRVVPTARLVDDLWEGEPPRTAEQTLHGYVSQLRKAIGADRLLTRSGGYELHLEPGELDAEEFEASLATARRALAAGEPRTAVDLLTRALAGWRGEPLADAGGASWAAATVARLEEARLVAIEVELEAHLVLGAYPDVITEAESAIAAHPLRERLWAQLMTALYHDGRQAEALRAFQRLRRTLGDELGIEPSREIVELEASIVRQELSVAASQPSGPPHAPDATSGTLTFLFTDLETSTRMWEEHGAEMPGALARHDDLLREAIESHHGRIAKTTGDGTFAVFTDATAGVRAAADAQRFLAAEAWGATGPLRARMAVHTGAVEERNGDYFGPTMNRAARLMAIGHGGQVLVSQATQAIVRDTEGIELLDLGDHHLRDLTRPERVFQVLVPGQPVEFPPLRSLDARATNLPVQLTTFIGRRDELQRVRALLDEHRVVTITGVGGVGKTRVALRAAEDAMVEHPDGAWWCELAAATDDDSMLTAVASALGVPSRSGLPLEQSIVEFLKHKHLLWVLDNCEHLLQPTARLVDNVLRAAPQVNVLATSREALDVEGERTVPLRSMAVAASDAVDAVAGSDAVKLFVDRAANARAGFELDESNASTVNTICRRLDGIPLAIELAAVRVVSMSPSEIAGRLDERFRLLTGGRRVALERHQTLRAAVEWSYEMLEAGERRAFDRLAVFAGSFDAAAAEAVVTDDDLAEWDVIDALDGLVRKSLLIAEVQSDGGTRYQLLETLRQYAVDRLDERQETDRWRRRHAEHFAARLAEVSVGLLGPDESMWQGRLERELDNLRAAIYWAIDAEETALVVELISRLSDEALVLWNRMGWPATRALPLVDRLEPLDQFLLLSLASLEAYLLGDMPRYRELTLQSEAQAVGIEPAEILLLLRHAFGADFYTSALRQRVVDALVEDPGLLEHSDLHIAHLARIYASLTSHVLQGSGGDADLGAILADRSLELATESQNPSSMGIALFAIAQVKASNDPDAALSALDRCIELYEQGASARTGSTRQGSLGALLYLGALILARRGDRASAIARLRRSITLLVPQGRTAELDGGFGYSIEILIALEEPDAAVVIIGAVLGGTLQNLRDVNLPPDRTAPDVRSLRETIGVERFRACVDHGAKMSYEELITWLLSTLDAIASTPPLDPPEPPEGG